LEYSFIIDSFRLGADWRRGLEVLPCVMKRDQFLIYAFNLGNSFAECLEGLI